MSPLLAQSYLTASTFGITPEHYRRDRRKDALLQRHGYLILRFLAEDLGKHLDAVLDAIHRAVASTGK